MYGFATLTDPARVRALNDAFRRSFAGGRVVVTAGVASLTEETRVVVLGAVRAFNCFEADNDTSGEHDFGTVEVGAVRCF